MLSSPGPRVSGLQNQVSAAAGTRRATSAFQLSGRLPLHQSSSLLSVPEGAAAARSPVSYLGVTLELFWGPGVP